MENIGIVNPKQWVHFSPGVFKVSRPGPFLTTDLQNQPQFSRLIPVGETFAATRRHSLHNTDEP
jgi:hypothetical protein